jgi:hypothetical protein
LVCKTIKLAAAAAAANSNRSYSNSSEGKGIIMKSHGNLLCLLACQNLVGGSLKFGTGVA